MRSRGRPLIVALFVLASCAPPERAKNHLPPVSVEPAKANGSVPYEPPSQPTLFRLQDVFELEWAADPQISPDGKRIVYVRSGMNIATDRRTTSLWFVTADGAVHRPFVSGQGYRSPRWSPSGDRVLFVGASSGKTQIFMRWTETGIVSSITRLQQPPQNLTWSPDGKHIAFTMRVPAEQKPLVKLPKKPKDATWASPPISIDKSLYRIDGQGYIEHGYEQLFVVRADGGTPRQVTSGDYHHSGAPSWTKDGKSLVISANRDPQWELKPEASELYIVDVASLAVRALTSRVGPDSNPQVSPDGKWVAYTGYDDRRRAWDTTRLYISRIDGSARRELVKDLDRSVSSLRWGANSEGIYFMYDDRGNGKLGFVSLGGRYREVARDVGGLSIGRPYGGGDYSVSRGGLVFTGTRPDHPADVMIAKGGEVTRLTNLNLDLFGNKQLGAAQELWTKSSHDGEKIQAWVVTPPGFDAKKKYPLILEIHGGPNTNYGDRFSAEAQLYAAAGYVVVYANPRGSTSYGFRFVDFIHHNYPGHDYDDLMSVVDEVVGRGYVDKKRLYVTGGSGGGVLTAWIVGNTHRFRAAVVAKPVINWFSFVLTADYASYFVRYWFPKMPWEDPANYMKRSPISLVGNVKTPTMLLTGEADYRTPISESEQYYQALKLRSVDTMLVRIPGASHGIAARPSHLMAKVGYVLGWFHRHSRD